MSLKHALPKYKACPEGYERAKTEDEYRFQLITAHVIRHSHSSFAHVKQLDEIFANDLLMSAYDAKQAGFKKGDWVLVTTKEGGAVARRVNPMPHLMPGVVILGQGNWRKIDQQTGVDVGANANTLCKSDLLGDGYQSYNSNLVKIERYVGEELLPEYKRAPLTAGL